MLVGILVYGLFGVSVTIEMIGNNCFYNSALCRSIVSTYVEDYLWCSGLLGWQYFEWEDFVLKFYRIPYSAKSWYRIPPTPMKNWVAQDSRKWKVVELDGLLISGVAPRPKLKMSGARMWIPSSLASASELVCPVLLFWPKSTNLKIGTRHHFFRFMNFKRIVILVKWNCLVWSWEKWGRDWELCKWFSHIPRNTQK